jgi:Ca2+-binding RTX toxin-like protein
MSPRVLGVTILLVIGGGTMTVGLLLPPLSPMLLIQSAEATTTSDASNCFIGSPTIVGTNNDDVIQGTEGDDFIVALGGNDRILGKGGDDLVCAGDGNDIIYGDNGNDLLYGGAGNDEVYGDFEDDCENDYGEPAPCSAINDEIYGDAGNDLLDGAAANDFGDGGPNFDTCINVDTATNCED